MMYSIIRADSSLESTLHGYKYLCIAAQSHFPVRILKDIFF